MKINIIIYSVVFIMGFGFGFMFHKNTPESVKDVTIASQDITQKTTTEFNYTPKNGVNDADIDAKINQSLTIRVNGVDQKITKSDNETHVLDKNKITMNQESKASIDIKTSTIDLTKKYALGVGLSNHSYALMCKFPTYGPFGGFVYVDQSTLAGGITIGF